MKANGTSKEAGIWVTVKARYVPATGICITDAPGKIVEMGNRLQLHADVQPGNASNKAVRWSTDDALKAVVDANGVVTPLYPTEHVKITATSVDGSYSASYELKISETNGSLSKNDLDRLGLAGTENVMIVAHPDDETLWGGAHLLEEDYLVIVLTNGWNRQRKSDFYSVMEQTNDKGIILNYPDIRKWWWNNGQTGYDADLWSTCTTGIQKDLDLILNYKRWEKVVTHNPDGEYRKNHHQMTSKMVKERVARSINASAPLYYFGRYYNKGQSIPGPQIPQELLKIKTQLVQIYMSTESGAINSFGHMIPYENWILSTRW